MFQGYGLKMNEMPAQKSINDKSSSPYHDWQRVHMGNSVVVADIDLLRLENGVPTEIIELKRSFIDIEKWEPYQKDYRNFCLISKLARKRGWIFTLCIITEGKNRYWMMCRCSRFLNSTIEASQDVNF